MKAGALINSQNKIVTTIANWLQKEWDFVLLNIEIDIVDNILTSDFGVATLSWFSGNRSIGWLFVELSFVIEISPESC